MEEFNQKYDKRIVYKSTTFRKLISCFKDAINDYDIEMQQLIDDFEDFCTGYNPQLIPQDDRMRVVVCGDTLKLNQQYGVYFDPADRGYSEHNYIGLYSKKCVQSIGELINIIRADVIDGTLKVHEAKYNVMPDQQERIMKIVEEADNAFNWNTNKEHKFFVVNAFQPTTFIKGNCLGSPLEAASENAG